MNNYQVCKEFNKTFQNIFFNPSENSAPMDYFVCSFRTEHNSYRINISIPASFGPAHEDFCTYCVHVESLLKHAMTWFKIDPLLIATLCMLAAEGSGETV